MKYFLGFIVWFIFAGCSAGTFEKSGQVMRVDPKSIQDTDPGYGPEDLHIFADKMVSSMLREDLFDGTPVVDVKEISNETDEHINVRAITNTIKTAVIKSRRAKFIDSSVRSTLAAELEYQNNSKYVDKKSSNQIGKHIAPNYMLDGTIMSIKKSQLNTMDYFYKITLKLHNIKTGTIDWIEEEEIRKIRK